jgi:hypothetical protein
MRIISDFTDYYDINLQYGIDPKVIYYRKTSEVPLLAKYLHDTYDFSMWREEHQRRNLALLASRCGEYDWPVGSQVIRWHIFVFCGKCYLAAHFDETGYHCGESSEKGYSQGSWHYDADSLIEALRASNDRKVREFLRPKDPRRPRWHIPESDRIAGIQNRFRLLNDINATAEPKKVVEMAGSPVLLIENRGRHPHHIHVIANPILRAYEFAKAVDPYTAFQEISMWVCNFVGTQKPDTVEISDKDKVTQHGYNEKSFRHPTKLKDLE